MLKAVTALNQQIASLAPVLNSPAARHQGRGHVVKPQRRVCHKRDDEELQGGLYIFAAFDTGAPDKAAISLPGLKEGQAVEVVGENRTLKVDGNGIFKDDFAQWDVHIYHIPQQSN